MNKLERQFLTAIRKNPEDAASWGAYADWLGEQGRLHEEAGTRHLAGLYTGGHLPGRHPGPMKNPQDRVRLLQLAFHHLGGRPAHYPENDAPFLQKVRERGDVMRMDHAALSQALGVRDTEQTHRDVMRLTHAALSNLRT